MNNNRLAISIHILVLLAHKRDEYVSSDYIAGSININPVLVRKEVSNLVKAGILETKEGSAGGSRLAMDSASISLDAVYRAVKRDEDHLFGLLRKTPNAQCPIGSQINCQLEGLYNEVEHVVMDKLSTITLEEFHQQFV